MKLKEFLGHNIIFLVVFSLFILFGAIYLGSTPRGEMVMYFARSRTGFLNAFFVFATQWVELWGIMVVSVFLLLWRFGYALIFGINMTVVSLLVNFLKQVVFKGYGRPIIFFENSPDLNLIEGVNVLKWNSFPSGHTFAGFAVFFALAVFAKDKRWGLVAFMAALMVGLSRVYLAHHFFRDIYAGAILGVLVTSFTFMLFYNARWYQNAWWTKIGIIGLLYKGKKQEPKDPFS